MTSVRALFEAARLAPRLPVRWGDRVNVDVPGVYLVSLTPDPEIETVTDEPAISRTKVEELLAARPELRLDGERPDGDAFRRRLESLWVPNEPTIYIGMSSGPVSKRVGDYYRTRLGARSPHAGGWPLKTMKNLADLWVVAASSDDSSDAEVAMLGAVAGGVSSEVRRGLRDPLRVMPFANLEFPRGTSKNHGIKGARAPRKARSEVDLS